MNPIHAGVLAAALALILTPTARRLALREGLVDHPNQRSLHTVPTPRTGGYAILAALGVSLVAGGALRDTPLALLALATLMLAALAVLDERFDLPRTLRFAVQLLVLGFLVWLAGWSADAVNLPLVGELRVGAAGIPLALLWLLWMTNAYNFMDGANGIAASTAIVAGISYAVMFGRHGDGGGSVVAAAVAGAAAGFIPWNFPRASIFMGDTGSASLGLLFGALGLHLARLEGIVPAILPVFPFLFDATVTIIRRAIRGEPFWRPHRSHFYQRLVVLGASHATVTAVYGGLAAASSAVALAYGGLSENARLAALGAVLALHLLLVGVVLHGERRRNTAGPINA